MNTYVYLLTHLHNNHCGKAGVSTIGYLQHNIPDKILLT